jgi:ankyrin repeat protein
MFSLVSSLLAVYYANNQAWKVGYLLLGNKLRKWIRGSSRSQSLNNNIISVRDRDDHIVQLHAGVRDQNLPELLVRVWEPNPASHENLPKLLVESLVPAPSSVLAVSAPGLLLAASLCFLLVGFGIYLGFIWTRKLDDLAGPHDSRDVFIIYLVSLLFCYCLFTASDTAHYQQATDSVRGTIRDNLGNLDTRLRMSERGYTQRSKATEERQKLMLEQLDLSRQILNQLETQTLLSVEKLNPRLDGTVDTGNFLLWEAKRGDHGVVQALLSRTDIDPDLDINRSDDGKRTALFWAAKNGHFAVVKELVKKGANVSVRDTEGHTALFWAVKNGHMAIVQVLIEQGAEVSSTASEERITLIEALIWALTKGDEPAVLELIEQGAIYKRDSKGQTALFWAVKMWNLALVQELITHGADVSLTDSAGRTALFLAVEDWNPDVIKELIAKGTDVSLKDRNGLTALDLARASGYQGKASQFEELLEEAKRRQ